MEPSVCSVISKKETLISQGKVRPHVVQALRDIGCSCDAVKRKFICDDQLTSLIRLVTLFLGQLKGCLWRGLP